MNIGPKIILSRLVNAVPFARPTPFYQAMVGFDAGQKCFPNPVISNDEGTERIPFVPSGRDRLDACKDANGRDSTGLTYEGELNKVSKTA